MILRPRTSVLCFIIIISMLILLPALNNPLKVQAASAASADTKSATDIFSDNATLNGHVCSDNTADITEYGFYWGTSESCTTQSIGYYVSNGNFACLLTDLSDNTTIFFRAYVKNDDGLYMGSIKTFTTNKKTDLNVSTVSASQVDSDSAALVARIETAGNNIKSYGFYYDTSSSFSNKIIIEGGSLSQGDHFTYKLTGLRSGTTYYAKAFVENEYGTTYGQVISFTMYPDAIGGRPSVSAATPSSGDNYATLYGVVNSQGYSSINSYGFYYGSDNFTDTRIEVDNTSIAVGTTFSHKLAGLKPGTMYYFKAYATNPQGTSYSSTLSFQLSNKTPDPEVSAELKQSILTIGSRNYIINGNMQAGDVAPYIKNNRTYLPVRPVAYALGISDSGIQWDGISQQVILTKGTIVVKLTINSNSMLINSNTIYLDSAPEITKGRVCLPIAQLASAFEATANWNQNARTVIIQ